MKINHLPRPPVYVCSFPPPPPSQVNFVNAEELAKSNDMTYQVAFSEKDPKGYNNGLTVEFEIDGVLNGRRTMTGEGESPRWNHPWLSPARSNLQARLPPGVGGRCPRPRYPASPCFGTPAWMQSPPLLSAARARAGLPRQLARSALPEFCALTS